MKQLTAGEITEQAMCRLKENGFEVWRHNQIGKTNRKFKGAKGCADITGYHKVTGIRLECEVKKIGDKLSDEQKEFLEKIKAANAHALIAHDNGNGGILITSVWDYYRLRIK